MKKIDTQKWGAFKIGDWFDVSRPVSRKQNDYAPGDIGFVASGSFNNGIQSYLSPKADDDIDKGGCITISPVDGYAFWQEKDFLGRGGAGSSIIIIRNINLNKLNALFIASILRFTFSNWTYTAMGNKDLVKESVILLPATAKGEPDYGYMEEYMAKLEKQVKKSVDLLASTNVCVGGGRCLYIRGWFTLF